MSSAFGPRRPTQLLLLVLLLAAGFAAACTMRNEPTRAGAGAASVVRLLDRLEPSAVVAGEWVEGLNESQLLQDAGKTAPPLPSHRFVVPLPATACVRIHARVRSVDSAPAVLRLQALRRMPAAGATDSVPADRIEPMPATSQLPVATIASPADDAGGWHDLSTLVLPFAGRRRSRRTGDPFGTAHQWRGDRPAAHRIAWRRSLRAVEA